MRIYRDARGRLMQRGTGGCYPVNNGDPQCDVEGIDDGDEGWDDESEPEDDR